MPTKPRADARRAISAGLRAAWADPVHRRSFIEGIRHRRVSPEARARQVSGLRARSPLIGMSPEKRRFYNVVRRIYPRDVALRYADEAFGPHVNPYFRFEDR